MSWGYNVLFGPYPNNKKEIAVIFNLREHAVEFLLPSKARLLGDEEEGIDEDGEKEGDMIDGLALIKDDLIGKVLNPKHVAFKFTQTHFKTMLNCSLKLKNLMNSGASTTTTTATATATTTTTATTSVLLVLNGISLNFDSALLALNWRYHLGLWKKNTNEKLNL